MQKAATYAHSRVTKKTKNEREPADQSESSIWELEKAISLNKKKRDWGGERKNKEIESYPGRRRKIWMPGRLSFLGEAVIRRVIK